MVFEAAKKTGIQRVVWTSTIVTFGPTQPGTVGDETLTRITDRYYTEYEETKSIADGKRWILLQGDFRSFSLILHVFTDPGK